MLYPVSPAFDIGSLPILRFASTAATSATVLPWNGSCLTGKDSHCRYSPPCTADCAVCSEGYATWSTYSCRECTERELRLERRVAVALVVCLVLAVGLVVLMTTGKCSKHGMNGDKDNLTSRCSGRMFRSFRQFGMKLVTLTAVKIVVAVWQIISQVKHGAEGGSGAGGGPPSNIV